MKILLVDDTKKHREAGIADLTALGHDVVAFDNYESVLAMRPEVLTAFDVALLDLLMPAEYCGALGGAGLEFLGQPFAIGYVLSVHLARSGIRHTAVATDMNHHHHPAASLMDTVNGPFLVNGNRILWTHAPMKDVEGIRVKDWSGVLTRVLA